MENITLRLNVSDLYTRLYTESGYSAQSRERMGLPQAFCNTLEITDDEKRIIDSYISASIRSAAATTGRLVPQCTVLQHNTGDGKTTDYYQFTLQLPANFPVTSIGLINKTITDYVVADVMTQWAMLVKPDEANICATKAQNSLLCLREILATRNRPVKPQIL